MIALQGSEGARPGEARAPGRLIAERFWLPLRRSLLCSGCYGDELLVCAQSDICFSGTDD